MSFLLKILIFLCLIVPVSASETVQLREVSSRVRLMTTAAAEESDALNNPLYNPQILHAVSDGSWIANGEAVITFDASAASNQLALLLHQRHVQEAEMATSTTDADNQISDLEDRLLAAQDRLDVEMARLAHLESLPDTNEVRIAEGRLRVAELTLEATSNELFRARQRLAEELISPVSYEKNNSAYLQARSRYMAAFGKWQLAQKPAGDLELERNNLVIQNLRQEITNLVLQIEDTRAIVALQKQTSQVKFRWLDQRIKEQEEALSNVQVMAPRDGYVSFVREFLQQYLGGTDRMRKNFVFARMPKSDTLVFRGVIDEQKRRFFAEGDYVEIRAVGRMEEPVSGRVASVSLLARDRSERDDGSRRAQDEYGVKAYDVTIRPDVLADWMRLGTHAECEVIANNPLVAASVPAEYLLNREGQSYLVLNGRMRAVSGSTIDGWFVLQDTNLVGATVSLHPTVNGGPESEKLDMNILFETSGELVPINSADVVVGDIFRWQKISWLIAEDTAVTSGAKVAVLDDKESREQVQNAEQSLSDAIATRESARQSLEMLLRQAASSLITSSNNVRIAEIDEALLRRGPDETTLIDARLQAEIARVTEADRRRDFDAVAKRPPDLTSPKEKSRVERAWRKAALQAESAELNLAQIEEGPDAVALERRRSALVEARLNYEAACAAARANEFSARVDLRRAERSESMARLRLGQAQGRYKNLTLRAPQNGVVRYKRVWSGSGFSKAAAGYSVGTGFAPMMVADMDRMEILADVPEKYYLNVYQGMPVKIQIPAIADMFIEGSVIKIDYLFSEKRNRDADQGRYSGQETLGETVFHVHVEVQPPDGLSFKAGAIARVLFPSQNKETRMVQP